MLNVNAITGKHVRSNGFLILSRLLGGLLLLAAALKIHGLAVDPLSQDGLIFSPWLHIVIIETELLLGLWLFSRLAVKPAWFMAVCMFVLLTAISLYQVLTGQASCGCFGKVHVNP